MPEMSVSDPYDLALRVADKIAPVVGQVEYEERMFDGVVLKWERLSAFVWEVEATPPKGDPRVFRIRAFEVQVARRGDR